MSAEQVSKHGLIVKRILGSVRDFAGSEVGWKAKILFVSLLSLMLAINGLNVLNSYVGRDFMTAIENRYMGGFVWYAVIYLGVFAATTVAAVIYRFCEERLGLLWREWLTRRLLNAYLDERVYYRLDESQEVANPDQRIAEDVKAFTVTTLSFTLMLLNSTFTVLAFSGVMWSISPLLFGVAVAYAVAGSYFTVRLGRPLVQLNYDQLDREADFRAGLLHVRENAESIALLHRERRIQSRLLRQLEALTANFRRLIAVNRNLGFFTTWYNYLIPVIPALVVAPLFIEGKVEFGVITQSTMAFTYLLGAFSLIVTQFQSISAYTAVIARLRGLIQAVEKVRSETTSPIEVCEMCDRIAYEKLTLYSPRDGRVLIDQLSVEIPAGGRLLIRGENQTAKVALFRATADLWNAGTGKIIRPGLEDTLFLPERPYLPPGTLRESLLRTGGEDQIPDERIIATLRSLNIDSILIRVGGLDTEADWDDVLSLGEQQLLAFTHLLLLEPRFVFLDRPGTALDAEQLNRVLQMLHDHSIAYITLGNSHDNLSFYDAVLDLEPEGRWSWKEVRDGVVVESPG
ncbi:MULTISPECIES: ABC transporter ATP-binding protein/permease [Methylococcus]|uniref:ABC transporter transmembrane domain-containing protein n=1 Tax=Methylococcus capsulatus TaxID=414 RepID=A0ABZ2F3I8_METCP|nr:MULTISPECIES: ABC transporter transmembrane domain-containing protein [Methylococcus]MDF9391796.1 ABC transporter ATP-binding protein/permease [Methylococcus capsulatus]